MAALSTDNNWGTIFEAHNVMNVLENSEFCVITSQQIKQYTNGGEARLLAKFDNRGSLPAIFRDNGLCLLANRNGEYTILRGDPFIDIPMAPKIPLQQITLPADIISLSSDTLTGEMKVIDAAKASGAMDIVFGEMTNLTIRGRSSCGSIQLGHNGINLAVTSVQVEVDGGFEGANSINLVEAKMGTGDSLSLRQLLYPHLHWEAVAKSLGKAKSVRSYALFYEPPILRFVPIVVTPTNVIAGANEQHFVFGSQWNLDIGSIDTNCRNVNRHGAPFPQANNFGTILSGFDKLQRNAYGLSPEELFGDLNVGNAKSRGRHFDYYTNALKWLGLVESRTNGTISLSEFGRHVAKMRPQQQLQEIVASIFSEPLCNWFLHHGAAEPPAAITQRWHISASTITRRRQCIEAWIVYFEQFSNLD
jgi:hypothetical protein